MVVAVSACRNTLAQQVIFNRETRAADDAKHLEEMIDYVLALLALGPADQGPQYSRLGFGQAARATGAHDAGKAQHPLRRGDGYPLRDHAAHGHAHDVRLVHTERIQHTDGVIGHIAHRIRRAHGQPEPEFERFPQYVGHTHVVHVLREADVAVVMADHTKARIHQRLHQRHRPCHQLHAQAHDEQYHRAAGLRAVSACIFDFDVDAVSFDFHRGIK